MSDQQPVFAETIESITGETREITLLVFDQGEKTVIELYSEDEVLASEEFSESATRLAIPLLMGMKRLREGKNGTVSELARFMHHQDPVDVLLLRRLADDFGMPMDQLVVMAWRGHWPSADELRRTLTELSESSRKYLISKVRLAVKRGEIKDRALIELVESYGQKPRPQPELREEEEPKKKKRSLLHPRRH